jgi:hypothetical protein
MVPRSHLVAPACLPDSFWIATRQLILCHADILVRGTFFPPRGTRVTNKPTRDPGGNGSNGTRVPVVTIQVAVAVINT